MIALALVAGALIAFGGFLIGYGVGFSAASGLDAEGAPIPDHNRHQTYALTSQDCVREFIDQLDRAKRTTLGQNARRSDALEVI